ncbi:MAG: DUF3034 family protein [Sphingopyxis sp.]
MTALVAGGPAIAAEEIAEDPARSRSEEIRAEAHDASAMTLAEDGENSGETDDSRQLFSPGGRLLLTGGVTQIEGAGGGGLSPWALIGTYGTRNQFGISAYATGVNSEDFSLSAYGGTIAYGNRIELSIARQNFNLNAVGAALGLGREFTISQTIVGAKVRLFGDAVLEQDSLLPQVSVGVQYKDNNQPAVVIGALAARDDNDFDYYVSATKIFLAQSLLVNATARLTRANQFGILGFGGPGDNDYSIQFEGSVALLLSRHFAIGGEYRTKPDNLGFKEEDAFDAFIAYAPVRNITATLAYVDLGNVALRSQHAVYASLQFAF